MRVHAQSRSVGLRESPHNKIDVFKQKLPKVPLVNYFPEYTGGADINKAAKYILWRFTQTNRARLSVYP
jgi:guanine nucleotide-binding protein G(i) subunit alpha